MISLLLNSKWDLTIENGNIATTSSKHALEQDVACVCREFKGEHYYNVNEGIPYWSEILGQAPPKSLLIAYYNQAAKRVPGVVRVNAVIDSIRDRKVTGQIRFTDKKGVSTVIPL